VVWIGVHVLRCAKHQHGIGLGDLLRRPDQPRIPWIVSKREPIRRTVEATRSRIVQPEPEPSISRSTSPVLRKIGSIDMELPLLERPDYEAKEPQADAPSVLADLRYEQSDEQDGDCEKPPDEVPAVEGKRQHGRQQARE
jgi:hypothetical protein